MIAGVENNTQRKASINTSSALLSKDLVDALCSFFAFFFVIISSISQQPTDTINGMIQK